MNYGIILSQLKMYTEMLFENYDNHKETHSMTPDRLSLMSLIGSSCDAFDKCHSELIETKELVTKLQKENEMLQGIVNGINSREVKKL